MLLRAALCSHISIDMDIHRQQLIIAQYRNQYTHMHIWIFVQRSLVWPTQGSVVREKIIIETVCTSAP